MVIRLADCAARRRALAGTPDDPDEPFIAATQPPRDMLVHDPGFPHPRKERRCPPPAYDIAADPEHMLEPTPHLLVQPGDQHRSGPDELPWHLLDDEEAMAAIEEAVESVKAGNAEHKAQARSATRLVSKSRSRPGQRGGAAEPD